MAECPSEDAEEAWYDDRSSIRYRLSWWLSGLSAGRIKSPFFYGEQACHSKHDAKEINDIRISVDERATTWGLWAVEAYTPDNIRELIKRLEALEPVNRALNDRNPGDRLKQMRNRFGGSINLHLHRPQSKAWGGGGYWSELPSFAAHAVGTISTLTPSLAIWVTFYVLKEEERNRLNEIAHTDHPTRVTQRGKRGVSISNPELERRRLLEDIQKGWSLEASDWQRRQFPGLFSRHGEIPMCELTILSGAAPFAKQGSSKLARALDMDSDWNIYEGSVGASEKTLFFSPWRLMGRTGTFDRAILSMKEADFRALKADSWGKDDLRFAYFLDSRFRGQFSNWATIYVLDHYKRRIASARDDFAHVVGRSRAIKALKRSRANLAECMDAATITREIKDEIGGRLLADLSEEDFELRPRATDERKSLKKILQEHLSSRAQNLLTDVGDLSASLQAQANLLNAHAVMKLQPWIILLAVLSIVTGAVAAKDQGIKIWESLTTQHSDR